MFRCQHLLTRTRASLYAASLLGFARILSKFCAKIVSASFAGFLYEFLHIYIFPFFFILKFENSSCDQKDKTSTNLLVFRIFSLLRTAFSFLRKISFVFVEFWLISSIQNRIFTNSIKRILLFWQIIATTLSYFSTFSSFLRYWHESCLLFSQRGEAACPVPKEAFW